MTFQVKLANTMDIFLSNWFSSSSDDMETILSEYIISDEF